jgi:hypothetical protein
LRHPDFDDFVPPPIGLLPGVPLRVSNFPTHKVIHSSSSSSSSSSG